MWKAVLVGVFALTIGMISLASAQSQVPEVASYEQQGSTHGTRMLTEGHIARLKSVLQLTPAQYAHWIPVEGALRALARQQRQDVASGFVQRMSDRATQMAGTALRIRRLAAVAGPLIRTLDDQQRQKAMTLVRNLGFESLMASAF